MVSGSVHFPSMLPASFQFRAHEGRYITDHKMHPDTGLRSVLILTLFPLKLLTDTSFPSKSAIYNAIDRPGSMVGTTET
jgi:hypothetical protein